MSFLSTSTRSLLRYALLCTLCLAVVACKKADDNVEISDEAAQDGAQEQDDNADDTPIDASRIVSLNGAITEILVALDLEENLVGVDVSSTYPESVTELPNIGYYRKLSDEGILGLDPTLIIGEDEAGPARVLGRLRKADVDLQLIHAELSEDGVYQRVKDVAKAVDEADKGDAFLEQFRKEVEEAKNAPGLSEDDDKPRILGVYARGAGLSMVGGEKTAFDVVIELAGAENAMGDLVGFQPLSPEALATSEADIILIPHDGLEALGGNEGLLKFPGVNQTPAGKKQRILTYDDQLLLGLGPRLPHIITELRADIAKAMGKDVDNHDENSDAP